jgi:hypothetical protein
MDELRALAHDCKKAALAYETQPGLVQPATIVDLYRAIARLAELIDQK